MEAFRQEQLRRQLHPEIRAQAEPANCYNQLHNATARASTAHCAEAASTGPAQNQTRFMGYYMPNLQYQQHTYPTGYSGQGYQATTQTQRVDQSHYTQVYQVQPVKHTDPAHQYEQYHQSQQLDHQFQPALPRVQQQRPASWHPSMTLPSPPVDLEYVQDAPSRWLATQYGQQENFQQGYQQSYQPRCASQQESYQPDYTPRSPQYPTYSLPAAPPSPEFSPPSPMMRTVSTNQSPLAMQQGYQQSYLPSYTPHSPQFSQHYSQGASSPEFSPPSPVMRDGSMDWSPLALSQRSTSVESNPPTPSGFATQQLQPAAPEPAFQVVYEPEEEGEVLVGLGLYDTPGKYVEESSYTLHDFPELGMPMLPRERTTQHLKLAEGWTPPTVPENEEEEEVEEDEGEDEE
ncbi:hypothetical protein CCMA1212_002521 [Trichoderma ghanense]|uniref:Uncharacterized protein n=1 Tax=Trichoderma ghanense TaxID=65468 RepID=A0ABY2HES0_9HYPO